MSGLAARAAAPGNGFPGRGTIIDRAGLPVDTSGRVWRLNEATALRALNWGLVKVRSPEILSACTAYIAELIKTMSATEVCQNFRALALLATSEAFRKAEAEGEDIPYSVISELKESLGHEHWKCHYLRKWYGWCCDQGHDGFSPEVAFHLAEMRIGGNAKAVAVRSADPDDGPLIDTEIVALLNALRASRETGALDDEQRAALWLCVALGCNPMQFALLREEDFEKLSEPGNDGGLYVLRVPRHKKRDHTPRHQFKARKLTAEIGAAVEDLIAHNRSRRSEERDLCGGVALPLFSRAAPRKSALDGPMREYALGLTAGEFTRMVQGAASALEVVSPRTGRPLQVTCRRMRYTMATRLVQEGASQRLVAERLDHTDLQSVQCYFDLKSDIVEPLDRATAMALGPVAQAFLGQVVRGEGDAVRGERPSSRVYRAKAAEAVPVGTCGSFSFCGLFAPVACYTCANFQPWVEAPHEQVLEDLLADRRRRKEDGLDDRMVGINDTTILAVADVVTRVRALREPEAPHAG